MIERTVSIQIQEHRRTYVERDGPFLMHCNDCGIGAGEAKLHARYALDRDDLDRPVIVKVGKFCEPCFDKLSE